MVFRLVPVAHHPHLPDPSRPLLPLLWRHRGPLSSVDPEVSGLSDSL